MCLPGLDCLGVALFPRTLVPRPQGVGRELEGKGEPTDAQAREGAMVPSLN